MVKHETRECALQSITRVAACCTLLIESYRTSQGQTGIERQASKGGNCEGLHRNGLVVVQSQHKKGNWGEVGDGAVKHNWTIFDADRGTFYLHERPCLADPAEKREQLPTSLRFLRTLDLATQAKT